jgi:hypothetical protein
VPAEVLFGLVRIVRAAPKFDIGTRGLATCSERDEVMELEKAGFLAASLRAFERTAPAVAPPDLALYRSGDVARAPLA